ncbi:rho-related protein racA-like [Saccostrea echinata]|uniref:rho-related protein racA-like n=1 Tax=Saccostrea echinata TaxID=191078 RepID=UPI002A8315B5|nr:rho-related protein racA-like [Saccostrea echinata]
MENCLKVVVLGGDSVGKTSLILVKTKHKFPYRKVPQLADPTIVRTRIDGKSYTYSVWDTKKIEQCEQLHSPTPSLTSDVFVLCFSVDDRHSFTSLVQKWLPQLRTSFPYVPVVLVACKTDLRSYPSVSATNHVTYAEGSAVADQHNYLYCETSALLSEGVTDCFNLAVRYADLNLDRGENSTSVCFCIPGSSRSNVHVQMVRPPEVPPDFEIESSTFPEEWLETLLDGKHYDVTFLVQDHHFNAHQVILCSASGFFCKLFQTEKIFTSIASPVSSFSRDKKSRHSTIHIESSISPEVFKILMEFLYTGSVFQHSQEEERRELAMDLINVARMFELIELKCICENILNEREYLNPSLCSTICDRTGQRMRDLFLNCVDTADVVFVVKGKRLYANKAVLSTRCEVMTRMFSGNFIESKSELTEIEIPNMTTESFLLFLDYLYSDHVDFESADVLEVLKIADMYCQKRLLTICEYCIAQKARSWTLKKRADLVFQVLLCVQPFHTVNLVNWCLFELSKNIDKARNSKEYSKLTEENRRVLEARGSSQGYKARGSLYDPHVADRNTCAII